MKQKEMRYIIVRYVYSEMSDAIIMNEYDKSLELVDMIFLN
jgi:hypothetical protein